MSVSQLHGLGQITKLLCPLEGGIAPCTVVRPGKTECASLSACAEHLRIVSSIQYEKGSTTGSSQAVPTEIPRSLDQRKLKPRDHCQAVLTDSGRSSSVTPSPLVPTSLTKNFSPLV